MPTLEPGQREPRDPGAHPPPRDARVRLQSAVALFIGVAASAVGYTIIVAFVPLVAEDVLGSPRWAGLPSALGTIGVASGTLWLSRRMAARGRRGSLALGYAGASVAAGLAAWAAAAGVFEWLAAALFFIGAGFAASRLSRYVAADLYEPAHRSAAIGWNVWAATLGAVAGPLLLESARRGAVALRVPEVAGPFAVTAAAFAVAGLVLRFLTPAGALVPPGPDPARSSHADEKGSPAAARLALVSLVVAQVVMVLIMTMTPVHIRHGGHGLSVVGTVLASHTFGMYAWAPVAGILADRLGRITLIVAAVLMTSASGILAAVAPPGSRALAFALFVLGLGWCCSFVAASALLTESTPAAGRLRVQGRVDSVVWGGSAAAGLSSGVLLSFVGYEVLSYTGAAVALLPLLWLRLRRRPARLPSTAAGG